MNFAACMLRKNANVAVLLHVNVEITIKMIV